MSEQASEPHLSGALGLPSLLALRHSRVALSGGDIQRPLIKAPQAAPAVNELEIRDLGDLVYKGDCYCLNEQSNATWRNLFMGDDRLALKSDADEQLLVHISFTETVKLQSLNFGAPADDKDAWPTTVKLFVNRDSMGFSDAESVEPTMVLELTEKDFEEDTWTPLKFVKFQSVSSLSIFCEENNGAEQTVLSSLKFRGSTVLTAKQITGDFGKKEEH